MKICYPFPSKYVGRQVVDGRVRFTFPGPEGAHAGSMYHIMSPLFPNATHQFDDHVNCLKKIDDNTTDLIYVERSWPATEQGDVDVPVITGAADMKIMNLVKLSDITFRETPAVLQNFKSLGPLVYWCSVALTLCMIALVVTRIVLHHLISRVKSMNKASPPTDDPAGSHEHHNRQNVVLLLMRIVLHHLNNLFYYSSDDFKFICLLYTLLAFFMIAGINSVFSTSQLIIDRPPVIKNYNQLIEHRTASPFFFMAWRFSEPCAHHDVECKMVAKYPRLRRNLKVTWLLIDSFQSIFKNADVVIASSSLAETFRQAFCLSYMKELPGIRMIDTYTETSRGEHLLGFPVSLSVISKDLIGRLKRIVESGLFARREMERRVIASGAFKPLAPNITYFNEQKRACDPDFIPSVPDGQLKPLGPGHIGSLVRLMVIAWAVASLLLVIETVIGLSSMR